MAEAEWLAEVFRAELTPPARERLSGAAELGAILDAHLAAGRSRWPGVELAPETYVRHLAAVVPEDQGDIVEALRSLHAADLYLACACARGEPRAIAELEREHIAPLHRALRGAGASSAAAVDEGRQRVREALLLGGEGRPPGIAGYGGRAQLKTWIRSIAIRQTARSLRGSPEVPSEEDAFDALPVLAGDPELAQWKTRYAADFRAALEESIAALGPRERTLLRQHYLDGLTIDRLAELHRVHRATTARWLVGARTELLDGTRQRLAARLGVPVREIDSLVRFIRSRIDMSLQGMLA